MTSASSASLQRPEVTSGQGRPAPRPGPWHWRTSSPAALSPATWLVSNQARCSTRTRRPVTSAGQPGIPPVAEICRHAVEYSSVGSVSTHP